MTPPSWKLPSGVNPSLWNYANTPRLADSEDEYFADHPLFEVDAYEVDARFAERGRVVDLGCGVGRHSVRMAKMGFDVTSVDLSHSMLARVAAKAAAEGTSVACVKANLCRLGCFPDGAFDYALSMFSTLGMIRTAAARQLALREAARILKPGGRLALHAHNLWLNLRDPAGRKWLLSRGMGLVRGTDASGDRRMTYRGVPGMEVHLYRWNELRRSILAAGLRIEERLSLDRTTAEIIPAPWLLPSIRAGGWLLFCRKP